MEANRSKILQIIDRRTSYIFPTVFIFCKVNIMLFSILLSITASLGRSVGGSVGRWVSGRWSFGRWSVGQWSLDLIKSNKEAVFQACKLIKKRFQHMCSPVKSAKSLRMPFFAELLRQLLLVIHTQPYSRQLYIWNSLERFLLLVFAFITFLMYL